MKKFKALKAAVLAIAVGALISACTVILPVNATSNPVGAKTGKSSAACLFGLFWISPDASIQTAAKNGAIQKISTVDVKIDNYLYIYMQYTTIVTGE